MDSFIVLILCGCSKEGLVTCGGLEINVGHKDIISQNTLVLYIGG